MQTLTQYEYLDRDTIMSGVADWIVKESPILKKLPMKSIQGNAYKYNVSLTLPTASWLTVGDTIPESTGTYEQRSTDIYTMIQNAYTDKSAIALNATQNPEAVDAALAAQAMAHEFENTFIRGRTSTLSTTKQFKGLMLMLAELESSTTTDLDGATAQNSQVICADSTGTAATALSMALMDKLIDQIKPGKADLLLVSRLTRRKLNALMRASGSGVVMTDPAEWGLSMPTYDGIPIYASDFMPDNLPDASSSVVTIATWNPATTRAATVDNGIIFALQLGDDKVTGLHAGEMKHEREEFTETRNAITNRYIWYVGAACISKFSLAALTSFNADT